jgi:hypothetical protein
MFFLLLAPSLHFNDNKIENYKIFPMISIWRSGLMPLERRCSFYRSIQSLSIELGFGYCDLGCDRTTCYGDVRLCEKLGILKDYLMGHWKKKREVCNEGNQELSTLQEIGRFGFWKGDRLL